MKGCQVNRFDYAHIVQRNVQILLGQFAELAAAESGAAKGFPCRDCWPLDCSKYIGAVARPADGDEQITEVGQVLELLDENPLEAFVIAQARIYGVLSVRLRTRRRGLASLS